MSKPDRQFQIGVAMIIAANVAMLIILLELKKLINLFP